LTFGSQTVGTTSAAQTVTLTNSGTGSLTLSGLSVSGSYAETSTCGTTVAVGGSCTISVTFAPTSAGTQTGSLTLSDNATSSTQTVALTGTAVAATVQHSVTLTWTESTSSVSGYNVYRSTQSGAGYTVLNSSLVTSESYIDSTVTGGTTYYYVVTAVSSSGVESAYSSQVTAVVPTT
jgi:hypothetical protein